MGTLAKKKRKKEKWEVESQVLWHTQVLVIVIVNVFLFFLLRCLITCHDGVLFAVRIVGNRPKSPFALNTTSENGEPKSETRMRKNECERHALKKSTYTRLECIEHVGNLRRKMEKKMSTNYH